MADAGLTLLELLVVVAILMLIALALPALGGGAPPVERGLRSVAASLNAARAEAIRRATPVRVVFDLDTRRYGVRGGEGAGPTVLPETLPEGVAWELVTAREIAGDPRRPAILFAPDGSATGGTVRLAAGGRAGAVTVHWLTGVVETARPAPVPR